VLFHDAPSEVLCWKSALKRGSIWEVLAHLTAIDQIYATDVRSVALQDDPTAVVCTGRRPAWGG
jgi:hypothetical protein